MLIDQNKDGVVKKGFWIAFAFYFLIAFEFIYMASPFALYFYSVYKPSLNFINDYSTLAWLSHTFLPHFVAHTSSPILKSINVLGVILTLVGLTGFLIGAIQVYYAKLVQKKAVTGGIYIFIRHPQYLSLVVCGLGILILWPRYLALLSYITMLYFYYFLARIEEKECEKKFGDSYRRYKQKTNMFIPVRIKFLTRLKLMPEKGLKRYFCILGLYIVSCLMGVLAADQIKNWSLEKLYAVYEEDTATISITKLDKKSISALLTVARNHPTYKKKVRPSTEESYNMLNYIMPLDWEAMEVPMNPVEKRTSQRESMHGYPEDIVIDRYKIVFTRAFQREQENAGGKRIMYTTIARVPLLEVVVDLPGKKVIKISDPVKDNRLGGVPLPLF